MASLEQWITEGLTGPVSNPVWSTLSLPLLAVMQICQYFQLLDMHNITHAQMLESLKNGGGAHGYCGGLPAAFAIACAQDEEDVVRLACKAVRLAFAVGAFGELGDDVSIDGVTTIAVRLRASQQADGLVKDIAGVSRFRSFLHETPPVTVSICATSQFSSAFHPGSHLLTITQCYVSAVTDPRTVSIVGPVHELKKVTERARAQGLLVTDIHIRGKVHSPENAPLVKVLFDLCQGRDEMTLPAASQLQIPVRSTLDGKLLDSCSLTHEVINTILASRCEWYRLLEEVAQDLAKSNTDTHTFALFGIGDAVPLMPFHNARLRVSKVEAYTAIQNAKLAEYE